MNNLDKALEFANYQTTLAQQRKLLKDQFHDACILACDGGLFKITPEFIAGLELRITDWVVDSNSNPICIKNFDKFIDDAKTCYKAAIEHYGNEFEKLRKQRSVKALTSL